MSHSSGIMTYKKVKLTWVITAAVMLVSGATTTVLSNDAASNNLSPGEILKKVRENYASLASYSDQGESVAVLNSIAITNVFVTRLARPNFYQIDWEQNNESLLVTNDVKFLAVWSSGAGNFIEKGAGPQKQPGRAIALVKAAEVSGGAIVMIPRMFFSLETGDVLDSEVFGEKRLADEKAGGIDCYVITREAEGRTKTFWVGKEDFLIRQIQTVMSAQAMQSVFANVDQGRPELAAYLQKSPKEFTTTETHADIVVNQPFVRSDFIPANGE
jgi:outer membrane lipoprotein-sorting protein